MSAAHPHPERSLDRAPRLDGMPMPVVLDGLAKLHQLVVVCSAEGQVIWLSDDLGQICGDPSELIGRDFRDLLRHGAPEFDAMADAMRRGEIIRELRVELHAPERSFWIDLSGFAVHAVDDSDPLFVGIVRLAPEEAETASTHRGRDDLHTALLDAAPGAVVAVDRAGFVTFANAAAEDILGWPREDLIDRPLALLMSSAEGFGQLMADLRSGTPEDREIRLTRPDGKRIALAVSSRPLRLPNGQQLGMAAYLQDISERVQLATRLERKEQELEGYVRAVSHDLRSPLVAVLGFARLLREDYGAKFDADGARFLERIEEGGRSMQALIEDIVELSRIATSAQPTATASAVHALHRVATDLKALIDREGAVLRYEAETPPFACTPEHLSRVLFHLVQNALLHSPVRGQEESSDRGSLEITIDVELLPDCHRLCVRDDGNGIDPAELERIFEPFQTGGGRVSARRSSGMGLAIVKRIAQAYGGTAWAESDPGKGSAFFVTFARTR